MDAIGSGGQGANEVTINEGCIWCQRGNNLTFAKYRRLANPLSVGISSKVENGGGGGIRTHGTLAVVAFPHTAGV